MQPHMRHTSSFFIMQLHITALSDFFNRVAHVGILQILFNAVTHAISSRRVSMQLHMVAFLGNRECSTSHG